VILPRLRPAPSAEALDRISPHGVQRTVRKDTAVCWQGRILEVRPELCDRKVELRCDL